MKSRLTIITCTTTILLTGTTLTFAANDTSNFDVSATVAAKCRIKDQNATKAISIADFDPLSDTFESSGYTSATAYQFDIKCTKDLHYGLFITGTNSLSDGNGHTIDYTLCKDNSCTNTWPTTVPGKIAYSDNGWLTENIYVNIPKPTADFNIPAGTYTETRTITIEW